MSAPPVYNRGMIAPIPALAGIAPIAASLPAPAGPSTATGTVEGGTGLPAAFASLLGAEPQAPPAIIPPAQPNLVHPGLPQESLTPPHTASQPVTPQLPVAAAPKPTVATPPNAAQEPKLAIMTASAKPISQAAPVTSPPQDATPIPFEALAGLPQSAAAPQTAVKTDTNR